MTAREWGGLIGAPAQNQVMGLSFAKRRVMGLHTDRGQPLGVQYGGVEEVVVVSRAHTKGGGGGSLVLPTKTEPHDSVLADDQSDAVDFLSRRVNSWGGGTVGHTD
jgi:hypothetical protein